ncbi:unnamed protein product [Effrenium voratum]|uniref:Pentatricopeptide repeat-containing protein n=1 Tax=Effrenium voratum TaxID=2562239 RepID=A0AA36NKV4_9DINO|nr:unnamed protein product [Effrenium voratum]
MSDLMEQAQAVLTNFSAELLLFGGAFLLQFFLFGNVLWPWKKRGKGKAKKIDSSPSSQEIENILEATHAAFEQGDHRTVLRKWGTLQRAGDVPAETLVQVVESMQRLRKDRSFILAEVKGLVLKSDAAQSVDYMNDLLTPLTKSLDAGLITNLLTVFSKVGVEANSRTYEILMHLHFATRSFEEVKDLAKQMRQIGLHATQRTTLVMLKTFLQEGCLSDALQCYCELPCDLPKHVGTQLVEIACRERRMEEVLPKLETGRIPMTTDSLNLMLNESLRSAQPELAKKALELAGQQKVEKNSRTYSLLVRSENDSAEIRRLLKEVGASGVDAVVSHAVLEACAKMRDVKLAESLSEMLNPNEASQAPAFMALIRFYTEASAPEKALALYDSLVKVEGDKERRRLPIDARTKHCLLAASRACNREDISVELQEVDPSRGVAMLSGKKNDIDSVLSLLEGPAKLPGTAWNIALDTCVENGELEKAKQLAKRMKDAGVMDVVSYNTLIKAYVRHNLFDQASALLLTMRQDPAAMPNTVTYHELISGLLKTGKEINRTRAWELVNEMKEDDVLPNKPMVSNLLRSLRPKSHSSEINRAMQLVDSIQHQVDEGLLCTVLEAGVRVGKAQVLQKKLKTFHGDQAEFPVKITGAHSFGSLIKAYGFVKDVAGAWNCWKEMSVQHLKPTNITLGCLVEAVASNGDVDGAHELIQRLLEDPETKSQVNAVIYGSILKGFSRKKRMDRVWDAFEEMKKHGIAPTLMTFNAILDGCVRNEEMSKVPELLSRMQSVGLEPNLITYSTMIKGFCNTGDMQSAFSIFEKLQKGPEVPDEVVYNTLLDGCLQAGLADEGEQLLEAMMAQGLAPSIYTLSVLVKLLASAKRLDKAFKMAENASVRFRFRLGAQLQSALLQACISCRAYERGARFYLKTHKDRLSADKKICQTIIRGLLTTGKAELAAELLRSLLGLHSSEEVLQHRATQDVDEALAVEVLEALGSRDAWHLYESLKAAKPQFTVGPELLKRMTASKGHNKCR